jgi:hypothetical protein
MIILEISSWTDFKSLCVTSKGLLCQYTDAGTYYTILGPDANGIMWRTGIAKTDPRGSDQADFEDNHKANFNKPMTGNVNVAGVTASTLPMTERGFQDLTGHNVYRFGELLYRAVAGVTTLFHEKFTSTMYISGGGLYVPKYYYVGGAETANKPELGDYCSFDLVDIDNILGYGKTATISKVARTANVTTITTVSVHAFSVNDKVCINVNDDTFDDMEELIVSVPDNTHFTYVNIGDDVVEKDATGSVGKIVVLAPFVPRSYVVPDHGWVCACSDAKMVPPGIYLRFRYISLGATDVIIMPYYGLRT